MLRRRYDSPSNQKTVPTAYVCRTGLKLSWDAMWTPNWKAPKSAHAQGASCSCVSPDGAASGAHWPQRSQIKVLKDSLLLHVVSTGGSSKQRGRGMHESWHL